LDEAFTESMGAQESSALLAGGVPQGQMPGDMAQAYNAVFGANSIDDVKGGRSWQGGHALLNVPSADGPQMEPTFPGMKWTEQKAHHTVNPRDVWGHGIAQSRENGNMNGADIADFAEDDGDQGTPKIEIMDGSDAPDRSRGRGSLNALSLHRSHSSSWGRNRPLRKVPTLVGPKFQTYFAQPEAQHYDLGEFLSDLDDEIELEPVSEDRLILIILEGRSREILQEFWRRQGEQEYQFPKVQYEHLLVMPFVDDKLEEKLKKTVSGGSAELHQFSRRFQKMKSATLLNKLSEDAKMKVPLQTAWQECEKLTTPLIPLISVVLPLEIESFATGQDSLNSSFFDSEEEFDDDDLVSPSGKKKRRRVKDFFTGKRQTEKKNEERARKARRVQEQARRVKEQALLFDKREERNAAYKARRKPFFYASFDVLGQAVSGDCCHIGRSRKTRPDGATRHSR